MMVAFTAMGAYVNVPVGPVPFTLQTLCVMVTGLLLGWRLGALSVLGYIVVGLVAPVYHGGTSGVGTLFGPTGGYLWGFVLAALVVGLIVERLRPRGFVGLAVTALVGLLPVYTLGASWLAWQLHTTNFHIIVWGGVLQFLPFDVVKGCLAAAVARALLATPLRLPGLRSLAAQSPARRRVAGLGPSEPPAD
jgi:biotin transport system substrate-specific component